MPSKLPIIKANTTHVNIAKMKVIAETNKRSVAKELEWLIERHINDFENKYGEIKLHLDDDEIIKLLKDKNTPKAEILKAGINVGKFKNYDNKDS